MSKYSFFLCIKIPFVLRLNTSVTDLVHAILKGYLNDDNETKGMGVWEKISEDLKTAGAKNDSVLVLLTYSRFKALTERINTDMARNTHHELTRYCTHLNCNVLARSQDGIQAFITILFHPDLNKYLCKEDSIVYRGAVIDSESMLGGYENGSVIITTTFLSTSKDPAVAEMFGALSSEKKNQISLMCTYIIYNYRHTALEIETISAYPDEKEVLIYPYVPFRILSYTKSMIESIGNQRIEVVLEQIADQENDNSSRQAARKV